MNCCVSCFQYPTVTKFIIEKGKIGDCEFCGTKGIPIIQAKELYQLFEPLLNLYEPENEGIYPDLLGQTLAECMEEWEIFSDKLDFKNQNGLLDEMQFSGLSPKELSSVYFSSNLWGKKEDNIFATKNEEIWDTFANHIKRKRRFLPVTDDFETLIQPKDWLPQMLDATTFEANLDSIFYRARLGSFKIEQMVAPTHEKTKAGRINPVGIPYLYVSEQEKTAVAEIRPYPGSKVSVAKVKPIKSLKLADLTKFHAVTDPFIQDNLESRIRQNVLLNILNIEFSRPISPDDCEIEYIPTQYLAEVILNAGYDGIRYKSSVCTGGTNIVFFNPNDLEIQKEINLVKVKSIKIDYQPVEHYDELMFK